eukprot:13145393-Alexandrium_andersonii.AAC.1
MPCLPTGVHDALGRACQAECPIDVGAGAHRRRRHVLHSCSVHSDAWRVLGDRMAQTPQGTTSCNAPQM